MSDVMEKVREAIAWETDEGEVRIETVDDMMGAPEKTRITTIWRQTISQNAVDSIREAVQQTGTPVRYHCTFSLPPMAAAFSMAAYQVEESGTK